MSKLASYGPLTVPKYDASSPSTAESTSISSSVYLPYHRSASSSSGLSTGSVIKKPLRVRNENVAHSNKNSRSSLDSTEGLRITSPYATPSSRFSHQSWRGAETPLPPQSGDIETSLIKEDTLAHVDVNTTRTTTGIFDGVDSEEEVSEPKEKPRLSFVSESSELLDNLDDEPPHDPNPFRRWMGTLHQNNIKRQSVLPRSQRWSLDDCDETDENTLPNASHANLTDGAKKIGHRKSLSWSSSGFATAVKSVRMSLATLNTTPQSPRNRRSMFFKNNNRSTRISQYLGRDSVDGRPSSLPIVDEASLHRAIQRRNTMEELVSSEESYVADLKVLVNVYFTLLASAQTVANRSLSRIHENITEILTLHEELLAQLRSIVYRSEGMCVHGGIQATAKTARHGRWRSENVSAIKPIKGLAPATRRLHENTRAGTQYQGALVSESEAAADIARVFDSLMSRFFVYEEYGARYESMFSDMTVTAKMIPNWQAYERGIEALANTLAPASGRDGVSKKGLTFGDLLIKPIQRICKYPLLFADLLKYTTVVDGLDSHKEVEKVLYRLRETAMEINKATNDKNTRNRIQRTWRLQDSLSFQDPVASPFALRALGHSVLCGVLHVAYQTKDGVLGGYMLCALFNSCLVLGVPNDTGRNYNIVACISLSDLRIEPTDNGKGLQCHTALYSWKIIFESDQQLFELILSACSPQEEESWKTQLLKLSTLESQKEFGDQLLSPSRYSVLLIDPQPLGNVFGQPGTLARRISIQRAATISPRKTVCQVFIKNTHALKDGVDQVVPADLPICRSKSLSTTNRIPILASKRTDRVRMEYELSNVWTKDLLPYPGMGGNRGEHIIRASANSVMRKISKASVASGFSKRSTSFASQANGRFGDKRDPPKVVAVSKNINSLGVRAHSPAAGGSNRVDKAGKNQMRCMVVPPRTSSANGSGSIRGRAMREGLLMTMSSELAVGAVTTKAHEDHSEKVVKVRWNNPVMIFKALSTEGVKALFK